MDMLDKELEHKLGLSRNVPEESGSPKSFSIRFAEFIAFCCEKVSMSFIIGMLLIVWAQVLLRYFKMGIPWAEEVCRYTMVWFGMIGASILVVEEGHIQITFLFEKFSRRFQTFLKIIFHGATFYIVCIFAYLGWGYAKSGFRILAPSLPITRFLPNLAIPVGSVLILINLLILIWRDIKLFVQLSKKSKMKEIH